MTDYDYDGGEVQALGHVSEAGARPQHPADRPPLHGGGVQDKEEVQVSPTLPGKASKQPLVLPYNTCSPWTMATSPPGLYCGLLQLCIGTVCYVAYHG